MDIFYGSKMSHLEKGFTAWKQLPRFVRKIIITLYSAAARRRIERMTGPARLVLFATNRCTRKCSYCFYSSSLNMESGEELSLSEIETIAATLPRQLQVISFTGGEPFLREDLAEIASIFWRNNRSRKLSINSNGDLPHRAVETVKKILDTTGMNCNLQVSIQTPSDLVPGSNPGITLREFATLNRTEKKISQVSALTTVCRDNLDSLPALIDAIQSLDGVFHKIQYIRGIEDQVFTSSEKNLSPLTPPEYGSQRLSISEQKMITDHVLQQRPYKTMSLMEKKQLVQLEMATTIQQKGSPLFPCRAGVVDAVILENGQVSICENYKPFASLQDFSMDFTRLWNSQEARSTRAKTRGCACTHPCTMTTAMSYDKTCLEKILL